QRGLERVGCNECQTLRVRLPPRSGMRPGVCIPLIIPSLAFESAMSEQSKLTNPLELLEELKDEIGISSTPVIDARDDTADNPQSTSRRSSDTEASDEPMVSEAEASKEQKLNVGRGAVCKTRAFTVPDAVKDNLQLSELFERVNSLLGGCASPDNEFRPRCPESIADTGLTNEEIEKLALKFLQQKGSATGRQVCHQIKLPYALMEPLFKQWKQEQLITYKGSAEVGDYTYAPTDKGRER